MLRVRRWLYLPFKSTHKGTHSYYQAPHNVSYNVFLEGTYQDSHKGPHKFANCNLDNGAKLQSVKLPFFGSIDGTIIGTK